MIFDLTFSALQARVAEAGVNPFHTRALWRALYRGGPWEEVHPALRGWQPALPAVETALHSTDGLTHKLLLQLEDGETIETVRMGYPNRLTACLSTQAGCAMGCVFCATGQSGFTRHLRAGEIVAQVLHHQRALGPGQRTPSGLRNLVLMGMGEPLHNYDAVMTAMEILTDTRGLNLGPGRITISTVGYVPGIRRMAQERRPYHLAVSLHGADDAERTALVPVGRRWPLEELLATCRDYCEATGRGIFFEWTLIAGANDTPAHARRLAERLRGIPGHVNLIPLNPTAGFAGRATRASDAATFQQILREAGGLPSTVRQHRGIDVAAGCGQLRAERTPRKAASV